MDEMIHGSPHPRRELLDGPEGAWWFDVDLIYLQRLGVLQEGILAQRVTVLSSDGLMQIVVLIISEGVVPYQLRSSKCLENTDRQCTYLNGSINS